MFHKNMKSDFLKVLSNGLVLKWHVYLEMEGARVHWFSIPNFLIVMCFFID
jgi:hypothetical protein